MGYNISNETSIANRKELMLFLTNGKNDFLKMSVILIYRIRGEKEGKINANEGKVYTWLEMLEWNYH